MEAALERFLSVAPSIEDTVRDRFDDMDDKPDCLERNMDHGRNRRAARPVSPFCHATAPARQQEAALLGDERFKVLAEQVDGAFGRASP